MRALAAILLILPAVVALAAKPDFAQVVRGELVVVSVERALYTTAGSPHFFIHVRVDNVTDRQVGVRLADRWRTIYPNQWGFSPTKERGGVDETRVDHPVLDEAGQATLAGHLASLPAIAAHGSLDYYAEFNASGRADVDKQRRDFPYLIVSLDGVLDVTDGKRVDQLRLVWEHGKEATATDLAIATPIGWKEIPAGAMVMRD